MRHATRAAALFLALAAPGAPARGAEIAEYRTRLDVGADGAGRAVTSLAVAGAPGETLQIPIVPGWANPRLEEAPEGLTLDPPKEKAGAVKVTLPPAFPAPTPVRFTLVFDVPEAFVKPEDASAGARLTMPRDSRTLRVAFVNTEPASIKTFELLAVLPDGMRVQAIREQLPKLKRSEVEARVRLGAGDGRQNALLAIAGLKQGDSASMKLEAVPARPSPFWLVVGILLSALYLVCFRDLVSPNTRPASR